MANDTCAQRSTMNASKNVFWSSTLLRHEGILLLLHITKQAYFGTAGIRSATADNFANIIRHSVEIGLLALVLAPIIMTGGIELAVGSMPGLCAVVFGKLWRDASLPASPV